MTDLTAIVSVTLSYVPPRPAPAGGSVWEDAIDYPGVRVRVFLPGFDLDPALRSDEEAWGAQLGATWGSYCGAGTARRSRSSVFYAPTLAAAEAQARAWYAEGLAVLTQVVARRDARLAQRAATIATAHAVHGEIVATE